MHNPLLERPFRIFVIGPMNNRREDKDRLKLSRHIPNIKKAAEQVLANLRNANGSDFPFCEVIAPPRNTGNIPGPVFSNIMHCDMAIADISTGSPNVFYELAMLHSRGVPTILITHEKDGEFRPSVDFYALQQQVLEVANYEVDTIAEALAADEDGPGQLESIILHPTPDQRSNPITTHFDGIDMVNVSAVTGIAAGIFVNFLQYILRINTFFKTHPRFERLIMVKPTHVRSIPADQKLLDARLGVPRVEKGMPVLLPDGSPQVELEKLLYIEPTHSRPLTLKCAGDAIIDFPTPISSLVVSRQYRDLQRFLQSRPGGQLTTSELSAALLPYERKLIDLFFGTISEMMRNAGEGLETSRFEVKTPAEIVAELDRLSAKS